MFCHGTIWNLDLFPLNSSGLSLSYCELETLFLKNCRTEPSSTSMKLVMKVESKNHWVKLLQQKYSLGSHEVKTSIFIINHLDNYGWFVEVICFRIAWCDNRVGSWAVPFCPRQYPGTVHTKFLGPGTVQDPYEPWSMDTCTDTVLAYMPTWTYQVVSF